MFGQIKFAVKRALGLDLAGRHYTVYPDDTFLVSYPKSGNTWVRFLLANLIHPNETVGFANINRLLPAPGVLSKRFLKTVPRPRILKSHEPFDVRFRKVIYLVRDPRDVAVSEYHFDLKKRYIAADMTLEQFIKPFLAGETSSYGSWWEHAASWVGRAPWQSRLSCWLAMKTCWPTRSRRPPRSPNSSASKRTPSASNPRWREAPPTACASSKNRTPTNGREQKTRAGYSLCARGEIRGMEGEFAAALRSKKLKLPGLRS